MRWDRKSLILEDSRWFLPGGGGVLQFDDLRLAEIDRDQAVLKVLLDGGQRNVERLQVTDGGEQVLADAGRHLRQEVRCYLE